MPEFRLSDLECLGTAVLQAAGATAEEAGLVVQHSLAALLSGEQGHGIHLGTNYIPSMRNGSINTGTEPTVERETPTTLLVDGHFNFGHYVSHWTTQRLIEKARTANVAVASIRHQCHVGRLIDYTSMGAAAGMVSLMMTDGAWGPKFMAPFGGTERRVGINPFSFAAPSSTGGTVGFDMTSGAVSLTKVARAHAEQAPIPLGWIIDKDGRDTTHPGDFYSGGSVLPLGGALAYKGYALAFMIEILADTLAGMDARTDDSKPWPNIDGALLILINVEAFRSLVDFTAGVADYIGYVKTSALAPDSAGIFYPGERSLQNTRAGLERGTAAIPDDVWGSIVGYAEEYGLTELVPTPAV